MMHRPDAGQRPRAVFPRVGTPNRRMHTAPPAYRHGAVPDGVRGRRHLAAIAIRETGTVTTPGKQELRRRLLAARAQRGEAVRLASAGPFADRVTADSRVGSARAVAAYIDTAGEPPTGALLARLADRGVTVLLPVLLPDGDLDWALDGLRRRGRWGLVEPAGPRLGPGAVASADVVVVPALAVSAAGDRLGRGGGSYDRALARTDPATPVIALLWDGELGIDVPVEPHDRRVSAAVTPSGWHICTPRPAPR